LTDNLRMMNRIAQANPNLTVEQKIALGLPVYKSRSPINPPEEFPTVTLEKVVGRTAYVRLTPIGTERHESPAGCRARSCCRTPTPRHRLTRRLGARKG
jgi:hypothetical protein